MRHSGASGDAAGVRAMRRLALGVVVLALGSVGSLHAQWLKLPTPGIPRTASGAPDLSAPAPRMPDGKPDLSGQWITAAANSLPCGQGVVACGIELPMSREGGNMGASLPGGLPYQAWAADAVKRAMSTSARDDPHAQCLPDTFLRAYGLPHIVKFVQTPRLLIALERSTTPTTGRSSSMDGRCRWIRTRRGTVTLSAGGKATHW